MIVLDASAVIELLLNTPAGREVGRRIAPDEVSIHAPHLVDLEVSQAMRRYARSGQIEEARGRLALEHLSQLGLTRYPHEPLLPRIWQLRHNLTAYDAAYVALAEALDAVLLTRDRSLAALPGTARIDVLG